MGECGVPHDNNEEDIESSGLDRAMIRLWSKEIEKIWAGIEDRHKQNRSDIHRLRNGQQAMLLKQGLLEMSLKPIIGEGPKPNVIERLSGQVDELTTAVNGLVTSKAVDQGAEEAVGKERVRRSRTTDKVIALVGLVLVMAQVYIMVRDSRREDSINSLTNTIQQQTNSINSLKVTKP